MRPRLHVHATCWNEERMLPFFLRHYEPVAERIFVYDDQSTDRSRDILAKSPCVTIVPITTEGDSYVDFLRNLYDQCWKRSRGRAEWVVVCNVDEHFFHPAGLGPYLAACRRAGVTLVQAEGFEMLADRFPAPTDSLVDAVRHGVRNPRLDKPGVFAPDAIADINYTPGRHQATPTGRVVVPVVRELRLLHYKHLGVEYVSERYAQLQGRRRSRDLGMRWGHEYAMDSAAIARTHAEWATRAAPVVPPRTMLPTAGVGRFFSRSPRPVVRAGTPGRAMPIGAAS
jgi:hypothetical protein